MRSSPTIRPRTSPYTIHTTTAINSVSFDLLFTHLCEYRARFEGDPFVVVRITEGWGWLVLELAVRLVARRYLGVLFSLWVTSVSTPILEILLYFLLTHSPLFIVNNPPNRTLTALTVLVRDTVTLHLPFRLNLNRVSAKLCLFWLGFHKCTVMSNCVFLSTWVTTRTPNRGCVIKQNHLVYLRYLMFQPIRYWMSHICGRNTIAYQ